MKSYFYYLPLCLIGFLVCSLSQAQDQLTYQKEIDHNIVMKGELFGNDVKYDLCTLRNQKQLAKLWKKISQESGRKAPTVNFKKEIAIFVSANCKDGRILQARTFAVREYRTGKLQSILVEYKTKRIRSVPKTMTPGFRVIRPYMILVVKVNPNTKIKFHSLKIPTRGEKPPVEGSEAEKSSAPK